MAASASGTAGAATASATIVSSSSGGRRRGHSGSRQCSAAEAVSVPIITPRWQLSVSAAAAQAGEAAACTSGATPVSTPMSRGDSPSCAYTTGKKA